MTPTELPDEMNHSVYAGSPVVVCHCVCGERMVYFARWIAMCPFCGQVEYNHSKIVPFLPKFRFKVTA